MKILGKLFGSENKVKIMRLFLFNPSSIYSADEVALRSKVPIKKAKKEIITLEKLGLVKSKMIIKRIDKKSTKKQKSFIAKKIQGWILNDKFTYLNQIQNLLLSSVILKDREIIKKINTAGKIKLIIIAGVFIQNWDSRADILIVGDNIKENTLKTTMRRMESEIGRELRYAVLETPDFQYRMSIYDKLVRDIIDYKHRVVLDKLGLKLAF